MPKQLTFDKSNFYLKRKEDRTFSSADVQDKTVERPGMTSYLNISGSNIPSFVRPNVSLQRVSLAALIDF